MTVFSFKHVAWVLGWICSGFSLTLAQDIPSPERFLAYAIGDQFTFHHEMYAYFQEVAERSPKVKLIPYGKTYEGRPLVVAAVSSAANLEKLDEIRQANLKATGLSQEATSIANQLPIVWFGFNVHGNEAAGMETSMAMLYALVSQDTANWLDDMVVLLDPCINPDGRDRYANWYRQAANQRVTPTENSFEHHEPWPGGRYNHYLFDLNRDWAWQSQVESQQRLALYKQWMPHVAVDFHEMGANSPFFFGPAAQPLHEVITPWQRTFQHLVGKNNAQYFDANGWLYFTREVYDLLYPSYGDTWPTYNGAIGFTYEQGGSGRAGRALIIANGDTLRLTDRVAHHFTAGWATLESTHAHRERLLKEFNRYFSEAMYNPSSLYKSYVIPLEGNPPERLKALMEFLDLQGITYGHPQSDKGSFRGFDFQKGTEQAFSLNKDDIVISAYQPKSRLVQVLMEPETFLEDSITYDLTAWSIPYVYDLMAFACKAHIETRKGAIALGLNSQPQAALTPFAWLLVWDDFQDVRFLARALNSGFKVRYAEKEFSLAKKTFPAGTLIISRAENDLEDKQGQLLSIATQMGVSLIPVRTGMVDEGSDFGSRNVGFLDAPRLAIVNGDGVSATSFGELWHYLEQDLGYPVEILNTRYLQGVDLNVYDGLILPSGSYGDFEEQIMKYTQLGGKVIAIERAMGLFTQGDQDGNPRTLLHEGIKEKNGDDEGKPKEKELFFHELYEQRERGRLRRQVAGSIFEVKVDTTHPLGFGLTEQFFLVKRNSRVYPFLPEGGWNVGIFEADAHRSGFTGSELRAEIPNSFSFGVEALGEGKLIYFVDSPIIRQFWYAGKLLLGNAIFLN